MKAGLLTEQITLKEPQPVKTETGSEYILYQPTKVCRAKRTFNSGDRVNENGDIFFTHNVVFEIRWFADLDENFRIEYKNQEYRILCIEENKRDQSIKIVCTLINE